MTDYKLHKVEPTNSIRFYSGTNTDERNEVLRISRDGVWANPDIPVDYAAKLVLNAVDGYVKRMVAKAVEAEREACAQICDSFQKRDVGMQPAECAGAIRARRNS